MTTVPFALSVHSLVNSVGTDLAFAAIIGLAILVLLYFAQARETASLRERLDNAAQWIDALESRLTQLQRSQGQAPATGAQPAPAQPPVGLLRRPGQQTASSPGAAPASAGAGAGTARPMRGPLLGAPAGMGGPALAAATHLIPLPKAGTNEPVPAPAGSGEEETSVGAPAVAAPATAAAAGAAASESQPAGDDTILAAPAPATAAALANGQGSGGVAAPPAPRPAFAPARPGDAPTSGGAGRAGSRTAGNGGSGPPAAALSSRSGGSRPLPPLRTTVPSQPSRARRLVPILIGLGVVVVVVVVLLIVTRNPSSSTTVHKSHAVSARSKHGKSPAVVPSNVNVAVLNGTGVTNLAHDVASRLGTDGYNEGNATIATAADQTHSSTIVAYLPGRQADARAVAAVLNLKSSAVQAVNQQAMGVACPGASSTTTSSTTTSSSSACSADVVVTVGSDLAGLASSATG